MLHREARIRTHPELVAIAEQIEDLGVSDDDAFDVLLAIVRNPAAEEILATLGAVLDKQ